MNGTTPITVTPTWNGGVATLTTASDLPANTYTVDVKNGTTDLGTTSVTVTDEKIASIKITSTTLAVQTVNNIQTGYASYKVLDQYGADITSSAIANDITFQSGVGTVSGSNGEITITPSTNMNLITFPTINITAYDSTSAINTSASLTTSTQEGTLSNFVLGKALTNANGKVLTAGDTTDVFYLPFTATDISGNPTSNYNLIVNGVVTNTSTTGLKNCITSTDTDVTAQIVKDPNNSNNAVIQVTDNGNNVPQDMPLVLSAMTYTAKTSSLNVTLKRESEVYSFKLQSLAQVVAENDSSVIIPFTALDEDGKAIKAYSSLVGDVTFSAGTSLERNSDGTASLVLNGPFTSTGNQTVTANTKAGQYSSLNISVQDPWIADSVAIAPAKFTNCVEPGNTQILDFGYNKGGLSAIDQYGRSINMTGNYGNYEVVPVSSNPAVVSVSSFAAGGTGISITGVAAGTATISFNVIDTSKPVATQVISTNSQTMSVVDGNNITGYTISTVTTPIMAEPVIARDGVSVQYTSTDYLANPVVYGTTASGAKVKLAPQTKSAITGLSTNTIISATFDNKADFTTIGGASNNTAGAVPKDPCDIYIAGIATTNYATTASTNLSVSIMGTDGLVHTLTTPINSTNAPILATSVGIYVASQKCWSFSR